MKKVETALSGLVVLEPDIITDVRGFFYEAWNAGALDAALGFHVDFVQDNHSRSARGVIRGLHYQLPRPQGKLVRCVAGAVWEVVVDIRRSSPTFTEWFGIELSVDNHLQLWVPPGFANGFLVLSDSADVIYKATDFYVPEADRAIRWDDPVLGVQWPPSSEAPLLSDKDRRAQLFESAELFD